jgi:hypothetical protein
MSDRNDGWHRRIVLAVALALAVILARPYAGCVNDGSRLASVESLGDRGTFIIDQSIFVDVPALSPDRPSPYPRDIKELQAFGATDKIYIDGHYYSDKPPVPAYVMAGVYRLWKCFGGPSAAERPDLFCLMLTRLFSGIPFAIAVCCIHAIGRQVGLPASRNMYVALVFAIGTTALPYAEHVNIHILILAVAGVLFHSLLNGLSDGWPTRRLIWIGILAGAGYAIDLAAGPMLCLMVGGYLLWSTPIRFRLAWVVLTAFPLVAFHHFLNYKIGGTFGPAGAVPDYFGWPGSPFSPKNLTGVWQHSTFLAALSYSLDMLFGTRGFLGHNLLLFLPLVCLPWLARKASPERSLLMSGLFWSLGTWLLYALMSNNLSGWCCSIRWFVPLLVPGFLGVCLVLREWPQTIRDAVTLGQGSMVLGCFMAKRGPWSEPNRTTFWIVCLGTLAVWLGVRVRRLMEDDRCRPRPGDPRGAQGRYGRTNRREWFATEENPGSRSGKTGRRLPASVSDSVG